MTDEQYMALMRLLGKILEAIVDAKNAIQNVQYQVKYPDSGKR